MRCAAAKDDVRKLEVHGLSVPAAAAVVKALRATESAWQNLCKKQETER